MKATNVLLDLPALDVNRMRPVCGLLERGAAPNALEDPDKTYLDWAIIRGHPVIADLLTAFGALKFVELSEILLFAFHATATQSLRLNTKEL